MDVARTALRGGVEEVTCFSLSKRVAASEYEYSYARLEGVKFEHNKKATKIVDNGVIFRDLLEGEDGSLTEIPGTECLYTADSTIISISQGPRNTIVNTTEGLTANSRGLLIADEEGHTTREGVFASGDVTSGARTVVEAVAHSKIVAEAMHRYIQSNEGWGAAPNAQNDH
jgi:glutamate synthase (NADPH/NADH) small chain